MRNAGHLGRLESYESGRADVNMPRRDMQRAEAL